jgi:NADH:ubiquinone oxidoreductase subunit 6 (subunit J)
VTVNGVGYYVFAAGAVGTAVAVVGVRSLHRAAYALAGFGLSVGLLFLVLGNELLFAVEVLVYGLAVPALVLVALELTRVRTRREDVREASVTRWWPFALVAACGAGALLLGVMAVSPGDWVQGSTAGDGSVTRQMGRLIFGTYTLPFGVSAVLLLTALVGAVLTARRDDLEEELEAAEEQRRRREERMRRRREDRERARRAQRPAAVGAGDGGERGEEE